MKDTFRSYHERPRLQPLRPKRAALSAPTIAFAVALAGLAALVWAVLL